MVDGGFFYTLDLGELLFDKNLTGTAVHAGDIDLTFFHILGEVYIRAG